MANGKANVYNTEKLNRKVLFKGLEHGYNTYPTDFDMIFNLRNEINIIVDAKEKGKKPVFGQTITYINISEALQRAGVPSYVIWVEHPANVEDIMLEECEVTLMWHKGKYVQKGELLDFLDVNILKYGDCQKMLMKIHNVETYNPKKHKFDKTKYLPQ